MRSRRKEKEEGGKEEDLPSLAGLHEEGDGKKKKEVFSTSDLTPGKARRRRRREKEGKKKKRRETALRSFLLLYICL